MIGTYTYQIEFSAIELNKEQISQFMGLGLEAEEPFNSLIDQAISLLSQSEKIIGGYTIKEISDNSLKDGVITIDNTTFTTGRMISSFLKDAEFSALFICTAGDTVETWTSHYKEKGDLLFSYIIDATGSLLVEGAMDLIYKKLATHAKAAGLTLTNRYSPGYCDWKVKDQEKLFSFFPPQFCDISLSDSCLMSPVKSVSGIIGMGKNVRYLDYICETCKSNNCVYRSKKMFLKH